jgi:hypothetical protein
MEADFSGYATKAGLKCSDGRTVTPQAFQHMDGKTVPLVWQHGHSNVENVLGHAILEARADGMYAYGFFNGTKGGQTAKAMVEHKDINALSIYANKLVEQGKSVLHGVIREVSLVLAGANPGALIDWVQIQHADGEIVDSADEALIFTGEPLAHSEPPVEEEEGDVEEEEEKDDIEHAAGDDMTVQDVVDGFSDVEKDVVAYLVGAAMEQAKGQAAAHSDKKNEGDLTHQEGNGEMSRNVFEQNGAGAPVRERHELSHDAVRGIMNDAQKIGSLRDAVEAYAIQHGIDDIDLLFPDAQTLENTPQCVLSGTKHSPFSRVKTLLADITQAEARAKGYIKGNYKIEEWFGITKRTTDPTTIYKKQKLDRDDVVDITSFDVIAWLKQEMRMMLEEELARAILLGDGRDVSDDDKIKDPMGAPAGDGIRSILNDHELFVTTVNVNLATNASWDSVVDSVQNGMEYYKGSGTPTFYTTISTLNKFLQAKDAVGRRLYPTQADVAAALGVDSIVKVEPMNDYDDVVGIIVNLADYNIGADKGGEVTTFEDFDIDYNQQKYLIETRLSGALTKIKSAVVIRITGASDQELDQPPAPTFNRTSGVVTIPTATNVVYKNADTGATLSSGAQSALAEGASLNVQATPASGYYFANDANTLWPFTRRAAVSGS